MLLRSAVFVCAHALLIAIVLLIDIVGGTQSPNKMVRDGAVASISNLSSSRR